MRPIKISRASGDETAIRLVINSNNARDLANVTAASIAIYSDPQGETLVETLTGERRGFDPAAYFPIIDADWTGTRYWRVVLTKGTEDQPLPVFNEWKQT